MIPRPSIYTPFAQAVPNKPVIDENNCVHLKTGNCGACETFCEADAILYDQEDTIVEVDAGAIIVATGFQLFDSTRVARYGYGKYGYVGTEELADRRKRRRIFRSSAWCFRTLAAHQGYEDRKLPGGGSDNLERITS